MKCYENQRVADWFVKQLQNKMFTAGGDRKGALHASEIFQCHRKTVLNRRDPVVLDRQSVIKFSVGFAMQEWFFGPEDDGEEAMGVIFSVDTMLGKNKDMVGEFKTTRKSYETYVKDDKGKPDKTVPKKKFDPTENDGWIMRTRAYCAKTGALKAHIAVFFLYSDDLHVWTLEFTPQELEDTRKDIVARRMSVEKHLKNKTTPGIETRLGDWECTFCPRLVKCYPELKAAGAEVEQPK